MDRRAMTMTILWPSFMMAGVMEGLVFSVVDPADLHWMGHIPIEASPMAVYSASFLAIWGVISTSGALTALVAELWSGEGVDLSLTRRFNLSAEAHGVLAVLAMREPAPQSAALTRWRVGAAVSAAEIARTVGQGVQRGRRPRLGRPALHLALTRNRRGAARGPRLGEWCVEWDGETSSFRAAEALFAPVAGQVADRPDAAVA